MDPNVFGILDRLFAEAECYCPPDLRGEGPEKFVTDENDVHRAAKEALEKLKRIEG